MKNNKNLAKPVIAVALAASFFASPLNTMQVNALTKAVESEDKTVATNPFLDFVDLTYARDSSLKKNQKGGVAVEVSRLVKCGTKTNYITIDASRGSYNKCYDNLVYKDPGGISISGKDYKTSVKKNYYANMIKVNTYSKNVSTFCQGYIQRKSENAKSATWGLVGDYHSNSKWTTIYINGKISKDGTVTVTSDNGVVKEATMKRIKECIKELWLNKVDYPETDPITNIPVKDKNAVRIK